MTTRHDAQRQRRDREALGLPPPARVNSFRRIAQRNALAVLGFKARELVKSHTIKETLALMPELSRATLYRAMRLSVDAEARTASDVTRLTESADDPLLL